MWKGGIEQSSSNDRGRQRMRWGLLLCLICPGTNLGKTKVIFYSGQVVIKLNTICATWQIMAFLSRGDLEWKKFCIEVLIPKSFKNFYDMDTADWNFKRRMWHGERYIEMLSIWNGVTFCTSHGSVCLSEVVVQGKGC